MKHITRLMAVIPTEAGRSAKRGERPEDGPEGVSASEPQRRRMEVTMLVFAFAHSNLHGYAVGFDFLRK